MAILDSKNIQILVLLLLCLFAPAKIQAQSTKDAGIQAFEKGDWTTSIQHLEKWLQIHPNDSEAFWIKGQAWEKLRQMDKALLDFNSLIALDPENAEALFERGRVKYQLKQYDSALDDFEDFLLLPPGETNRVLYQLNPEDGGVAGITSLQSLSDDQAYFHMGLCAIELKNYELAISYLDLAIETEPGEPNYYAERGRALTRLGENMAAIESYELALELDPNHKLSKLGLAEVKSGGDKLLIEELDQLIKSGQASSQTYKQRGFYRMSHGQIDDSISDFTQALAKDSDDPENYFYRAWAFSRIKQWKKAEADYTRAIELEPHNPEYYLARGQARYQNGEIENALADFTLSVMIDPDHASGHYHKGIAFQKIGRKEEACAEFKAGMDLGMDAAKKAWEKVCGKD